MEKFIGIVGGRAKTCLLLETPEAAEKLDSILEIPGIDMVHIGLNDMHLAMGMKFMFELLADGSVDRWTKTIRAKGIKYGFGGLASLDGGLVPGRMILKEHYRLGSEMVIISRAFCNTDKIHDLTEIATVFDNGIAELRTLESKMHLISQTNLNENHQNVCNKVLEIITNN